MNSSLKILVAVACLAIIVGVAYFVYQDQQAKAAAEEAAKERSLYRTCQETQPGRKWEELKAINAYCREKGYID